MDLLWFTRHLFEAGLSTYKLTDLQYRLPRTQILLQSGIYQSTHHHLRYFHHRTPPPKPLHLHISLHKSQSAWYKCNPFHKSHQKSLNKSHLLGQHCFHSYTNHTRRCVRIESDGQSTYNWCIHKGLVQYTYGKKENKVGIRTPLNLNTSSECRHISCLITQMYLCKWRKLQSLNTTGSIQHYIQHTILSQGLRTSPLLHYIMCMLKESHNLCTPQEYKAHRY